MNKMYSTNGEINDELATAVTRRLTDPEYVKNHLRLSIRKKNADITTEEIRKDYLDLELVLKIDLDFMSDQESSASVKVTENVLAVCGLTEEQAFEQARKNLEAEAYSGTMSEMLFGQDAMEPLFYIITSGKSGAAAALSSKKILSDLCEKAGAKKGCLLIPSSTEEFAIPEDDCGDPERDLELAGMVASVNATCVEPRLQLLPSVYRFSVEEQSIEIAASLV